MADDFLYRGADAEQRRLMTEQCIIVDENDRVLGSGSKEQCHQMKNIDAGLLHRAFSLFLFNSDGRLLLQQRSKQKITFPSRWTNTCCSHPLYFPEELEEPNHVGVKRAAQRKLEHELGIPRGTIPLDDFHFLTRIHYKAHSDNTLWGEHEVDHILFVQKDVEVKINENEVEATRYVSKHELVKMIKDGNLEGGFITPWFEMIARNFLYHWWDNLALIVKNGDEFDPTSQQIHRLSLESQ